MRQGAKAGKRESEQPGNGNGILTCPRPRFPAFSLSHFPPRFPLAMLRVMSIPDPQVRRATVEDVSKLIELWKGEGLASEALAKRFGEFQVVEQPGGSLMGAVGLQISGQE